MAQTINTNVASLNSQRQLNKSQSSLNTALERLSSGLRINSSKDDAAGLAISSRMTSQINGMDQAVRNANDGISMSQTAESSLSKASDLLQRIRQLSVQSSNASNSSSDREAIQSEVSQLTSELDRIATSTQFNGQNLLDGTAGTSYYQVGANANQVITTTGANFRTSNYGDNRVNNTGVTATAATAVVDGAITIDGYLGSKTVNSVAADKDTAKTMAAKINAETGNTGVTATARTTANITLGGTAAASESYSFSILSDNATAVTVSFSVSGQNADGYAAGVAAINAQSANTGVTAEYDQAKGGIKLTNATGNDITLDNTKATDNTVFNVSRYDATSGALTGTYDAKTAGTDTVINGQITYDSQQAFAVADTSGLLSAGAANVNGTSALQSVSSLDVTTFEKSQLAIAIVDSALSAINTQLANFGAVQNRFTSVVSNLQASSENLSASRGRIQDADFAAETSNMSKANILQQAGTAMLAQANSSTQNVLTLLK